MALLAIGIMTATCATAAFLCPNKVYDITVSIIRRLALAQFYVGYKILHPALAKERRQALIKEHGAQEFKCRSLDALYIKASSPCTGNIFIPCLNTTYQDHDPKQWKTFLENGSDILLWNPSQVDPKTFANDLSSILRL